VNFFERIKSEICQRLELIKRLYSLSEERKWLLLEEYILFLIDWGEMNLEKAIKS